MKKIFTLIAMALMTVGASAQLIDIGAAYTEAQAAGTVSDITLGEGGFTAQFTGGGKAKIDSKSLTFKVDASSEAENFKMQWNPGGGITKLNGERSVIIKVSKAGTLTIYPRSAGSDDRAFTVQQNGETILNGTAYNGAQFEEKYFKAWAVEVAAGTVNILSESAISISALKFEATPGQEDPVETTTIASWNQGTAIGATFTAVGTAVLDYAGKINVNHDNVTAMSFPNSAVSDNALTNYVKVEGDFKTGDIVTVQPFTNMSNADFTGGSKYANIVLYDIDGNEIKDMTGSAAGALTVTDGHEEAGDPKEFSYTLTKDFTTICIGRKGGTRISVIKFEIGRPTATGISVATTTSQADGKWYNLQGQEVAAPTKGIFIKNGKKVVIK